ncbi:fetal and adult testis-expressed transcript protein [Elephas maximus indicus]|uniref:fetal and adult testis-expressed transcript protein n=1 Tax=Elephas maximus indicus TaxID=99487 RepID=UPI002115E607|nr:fetal and adult testis-expressed transcript protein [Elephas maximus indicus]
MAGGPLSLKEEMEASLAEERCPGDKGPSQEQLMTEMMDRGFRSLGAGSQRRQKLESKAAGSTGVSPAWNTNAPRPKKAVLYGTFGTRLLGLSADAYPPTSLLLYLEEGQELLRSGHRTAKESGHGDAHAQEYPGGFQGVRYHYERNPETDLLAEIGLEELNGLEMEVMRRQLRVITGRLQDLEDEGTTWYNRETLFFIILASACVVNLWLWMRH